MTGVMINVLAVLLGGLLGLLCGKRIPQRLRDTVMQGLGLSIILVGILNAIKTQDVLAIIISVALGGLIGELINVEKGLEFLGDKAKGLLIRGDRKDDGFVQGFVTASLVFCVGAMAIVGSLEAGIRGENATLIAKAALDAVGAVFFAAAMGPGVLLSAVAILIYQGAIALCGQWIAPLLSDPVITEMTAVGGVLIIGIGLNMLGITKIRLGNLLPSVLIAVMYVPIAAYLAGVF